MYALVRNIDVQGETQERFGDNSEAYNHYGDFVAQEKKKAAAAIILAGIAAGTFAQTAPLRAFDLGLGDAKIPAEYLGHAVESNPQRAIRFVAKEVDGDHVVEGLNTLAPFFRHHQGVAIITNLISAKAYALPEEGLRIEELRLIGDSPKEFGWQIAKKKAEIAQLWARSKNESGVLKSDQKVALVVCHDSITASKEDLLRNFGNPRTGEGGRHEYDLITSSHGFNKAMAVEDRVKHLRAEHLAEGGILTLCLASGKDFAERVVKAVLANENAFANHDVRRTLALVHQSLGARAGEFHVSMHDEPLVCHATLRGSLADQRKLAWHSAAYDAQLNDNQKAMIEATQGDKLWRIIDNDLIHHPEQVFVHNDFGVLRRGAVETWQKPAYGTLHS